MAMNDLRGWWALLGTRIVNIERVAIVSGEERSTLEDTLLISTETGHLVELLLKSEDLIASVVNDDTLVADGEIYEEERLSRMPIEGHATVSSPTDTIEQLFGAIRGHVLPISVRFFNSDGRNTLTLLTDTDEIEIADQAEYRRRRDRWSIEYEGLLVLTLRAGGEAATYRA